MSLPSALLLLSLPIGSMPSAPPAASNAPLSLSEGVAPANLSVNFVEPTEAAITAFGSDIGDCPVTSIGMAGYTRFAIRYEFILAGERSCDGDLTGAVSEDQPLKIDIFRTPPRIPRSAPSALFADWSGEETFAASPPAVERRASSVSAAISRASIRFGAPTKSYGSYAPIRTRVCPSILADCVTNISRVSCVALACARGSNISSSGGKSTKSSASKNSRLSLEVACSLAICRLRRCV
mmetsp:Transcript_14551/g.36845  ORF Transcript_14551/g.36845 Transcript_14551/m.36845 type:complete len:238 (-) Transcript_14551:1895-2608(-)